MPLIISLTINILFFVAIIALSEINELLEVENKHLKEEKRKYFGRM